MNGALNRWLSGGLLGVLAAASLGLAGCSSDKAPPAPLQPVQPQIAGRQVWRLPLGSDVSFPMATVVRDGKVFAASDNGSVVAVEAATGREIWRTRVDGKLSAGVGSDGRFAAVVTQDNELVVLDAGKDKWKARLDARVVTAPLVAGERVFVMSVDRAVSAYDVLDGHKLWTLRRPGDALTLAQSSVLAAYKDTLLAAQGSRLLGLDPTQGNVRWEATVATPRGTNEVERLSDLVGPPARNGNVLCMRAFQTGVGCVDADRGAVLWTMPGGGVQSVAADADYVFSADASDRISARRRRDGNTVWTNERFLNRGLSAPISVGKTVVFGDFEGQVHFLSRDAGTPLLRLPTDGSAVIGVPVLSDTTMVVTTRNGGLFGFRPE
ncbi:outer membrane protein assembly factor BamB [Ideonella azotifigens]|uniref:Outer membrane protein assembly factor BamB n=2 Tax=Ideonella azotifigens TaxID=513160 RepID=A0ABN1K3K6_9BURK|nr:outer membrane protein assembly factor BamB [Ideonella azotifigens]MCD2343920.1 outer membrane protein assembly factor BamB [Ideonella azotifigens]